jgi:hypothetical protein
MISIKRDYYGVLLYIKDLSRDTRLKYLTKYES